MLTTHEKAEAISKILGPPIAGHKISKETLEGLSTEQFVYVIHQLHSLSVCHERGELGMLAVMLALEQFGAP